MQIQYNAEPTAQQFHKARDFVRGIMGPIGSGKSVACIMEIVAKALSQSPSIDGVRHSRWACIRNTYPELKSTLIKSWQDWLPDSVCPIRWDVPITGSMKIPDIGDGTGLDLEVIFLALDRPADVKKLLSLELTGGWLNEAKELDKSVLDMLTGRVGRYPGKKSMPQGVVPWSGVIMDTNPMDEDHWWYRLAEEEKPVGYRFFRQPGAVIYRDGRYFPNPAAENIKNHSLGFDYYMRQLAGKQHEWIKVFIMGDYGCVIDGRPVYPEYTDTVHCASEVNIAPIKGTPLMLGWDFGLTPSCIIGQLTTRGKLLVVDELTSESMGIRQFATDVVVPYLSSHYREFDFYSTGDPAGVQRGQNNEATCLQELAAAGIPTDPAWTNDPTARREAVAGFLNKMVDGQPAFVLSPKCRVLRKGFLGGYQYKRIQTSGGKFADRPEKNEYSHPHDALQYLALAFEEKKKRDSKAKSRAKKGKVGRDKAYSPADSCAGY